MLRYACVVLCCAVLHAPAATSWRQGETSVLASVKKPSSLPSYCGMSCADHGSLP